MVLKSSQIQLGLTIDVVGGRGTRVCVCKKKEKKKKKKKKCVYLLLLSSTKGVVVVGKYEE